MLGEPAIAMGQVIIRRDRRYIGAAQRWAIYVDGERAGGVWSGGSLTVALPAGRHELRVRAWLARSKVLSIELNGDETVRVRAGFRGNAITALFWQTLRPRQAVVLEDVRVSGASDFASQLPDTAVITKWLKQLRTKTNESQQ